MIGDSCIQSQSCPVASLTLNCKSLFEVVDRVLYLVELLQLTEEGEPRVRKREGEEGERERERL